MASKKQIIIVKDKRIELLKNGTIDFISLTDIARYKNPSEPKDIIKNWMRTKSTIEFLGIWELLHNPISKGSKSTPY
ncbi:MAG: KilA-N domain-containing protein [Sediminibacterium sp.]|uniref:KilA-N domain-containing protein n=1 Tax=Sediminibacterium sp. TaxID=1917865 RepID=UPI002AB8C099|nr:KilA-N domain-containing protein [Sediminibacterium sp.]MDZ4071268.1 KilA-N domain-containing protein [Sediminibacterium sp.]